MKAHKYSLPKFTPRLTAFLLFLSMLLSVFAVFPSYAVAIDETVTENTVTELEPIETEEQIFTRLTADSLMLDYIDEESFRTAGHVNRLHEEEDLNSYVFENADGTRTAYILAEPVKYVDGTGAVREKNLTLSTGKTPNASVMAASVNTSAYTVTATNTPMTFSNDLSQGVSFSYGDYTITLRPETVSTATTILQADGKVLYRNAFGATAHLAYTPQLNGLKEDIVLTRYTGQNTFSFLLDTDGLIPAFDAGGYYLHDGTDLQIRLGQVVSYDANGDFSMGEMTVEPIGGTNYRVTLTVDKEFLEDAFYPVTVDPTLRLDNVSAIEEITVYNDGTVNNGSTTHAGYMRTTLKYARTVVRIKGLATNTVYNAMSSTMILTARLYMKNATTETRGMKFITYRCLTENWSEATGTGINISYNSNTPIGPVHTAANSMNYSNFDITDFAKKWKAGTWSLDSGFVIVVNNEPSAESYGTFYTGESDSSDPYFVLLYQPYVGINHSGSDYMQIGEQRTLETATLPENYTISWTSSNNAVATVNTSGVVTGVSEGSVTITATVTTSDNLTDSSSRTLYVVPIMSGTYYIQNRKTIKFLTIDSTNIINVHMDNGAKMEQWSHSGGNEQRFTITRLSDGYYKIVSVKSGLALSVNSSKLGTPDEALVQYTYSGADYQKWKIIPTENGAFKIKAKSSENYSGDLVMCVGSGWIDNGTDIEQRKYKTNTSYLDEWYLTMLPLSGGEKTYNPSRWNDDAGIRINTNCYAYALNNQTIPLNLNYPVLDYPYYYQTYMQPGQSQNLSIVYTKIGIKDNVEVDAENYGFEFVECDRDDVCDNDQYKIALVIDNEGTNQDYHWYRQNKDGTWSHKIGGNPVINYDASGKLIYDPESANRNYEGVEGGNNCNYSVFAGYYMVTPMGNMVIS